MAWDGDRSLEVLGTLRARLPAEPCRAFFGDREFWSLHEAMAFFSLYSPLLEAVGCRLPARTCDFIERSRSIHQNHLSTTLSWWFLERFAARAAVACLPQLQPLVTRGLNWNEIGQVLLYCGLTPFRPTAEEDARAGEPDWLRDEVTQLALRRDIIGPQALLVFKHMRPEQFLLVLEFLMRLPAHGYPRVSTFALLNISHEHRRQWAQARVIQEDWHRHFAPATADALVPQTRARTGDGEARCLASPSLYNRLRFSDAGLDVAIPKGNTLVWYRVSPAAGRIFRLKEGVEEEDAQYHFALKRTGKSAKACTVLRRGGADILLAFWDSIRHRRQDSWHYGVDHLTLRRLVAELLDSYSTQLLAACDQDALAQARTLTKSHATAWDVYGILRKGDSEGCRRMLAFFEMFPGLVRCLPRRFLHAVVIPGRSLREVCPYWSPEFRMAAETNMPNRRAAHRGLVLAALQGLGAKVELDQGSVSSAVDGLIKCGFYWWRKADRPLEAFGVFLLRHAGAASAEETSRTLDAYSFVRETRFVVQRNATAASLRCRYNEWAAVMARMADEPVRFPRAWMADRWQNQHYQIVYLQDTEALCVQARIQQNCLHQGGYRTSVALGYAQIYSLRDRETGDVVGTIELKRNHNGDVVRGEARGRRNRPLPSDAEAAIDAWFGGTPSYHTTREMTCEEEP